MAWFSKFDLGLVVKLRFSNLGEEDKYGWTLREESWRRVAVVKRTWCDRDRRSRMGQD